MAVCGWCGRGAADVRGRGGVCAGRYRALEERLATYVYDDDAGAADTAKVDKDKTGARVDRRPAWCSSAAAFALRFGAAVDAARVLLVQRAQPMHMHI